jgi:hypothetical protein
MLIECDSCQVRQCADCVVPTLLQVGDTPVPDPVFLDPLVELEDGELAALDVLAELGMVPPLRHESA